jgi:transporter family protein
MKYLGYLGMTIVALVAYTVFPLLVNRASQEIPISVVTLVATTMLAVGSLLVVIYQDVDVLPYLTSARAPSVYVAGLALTVGIIAYYHALANGPVSVVVPVFGMFVVTSSILSILLLNESFTLRKGLGIVFAAIATYITISYLLRKWNYYTTSPRTVAPVCPSRYRLTASAASSASSVSIPSISSESGSVGKTRSPSRSFSNASLL